MKTRISCLFVFCFCVKTNEKSRTIPNRFMICHESKVLWPRTGKRKEVETSLFFNFSTTRHLAKKILLIFEAVHHQGMILLVNLSTNLRYAHF